MTRPELRSMLRGRRDLLGTALTLGLGGGLIEGVSHMLLQKLNVLENVWYQIIWIAALFDAALLGVLALALCVGLSFFPHRPRARTAAVFLLIVASTVPTLALLLKNRLYSYAILFLTLGISASLTRWFSRREDERLRLFRRGLPGVALVTVLAVVGIQGQFWLRERMGTARLPPADESAPNILVIVVDTLRADHLSSYGYHRSTSPNIDRLATEGVLFEHAFSTSSYTLPSHVSMLTGLYPHQHGVEWDNAHAADVPGHPTLAATLQARGYRTAAFSGNRFYFTREQGFGRGFLHFEDFFQSLGDMAARTAYGRIADVTVLKWFGAEGRIGRKTAADSNRAALQWVGQGGDPPFFVFINYNDAHDPYVAPEPDQRRFSAYAGTSSVDLHHPGAATPEQVQGVIDAYDECVAYVDDQVAVLLAALQRGRTGRDLLVVLTSDHGEAFFEHGLFTHGHSLDWELIHVPLILWRPGQVPAGVRLQRPVTIAALPATIMDLLLPGNTSFPGPSLARLWETPAAASEWPLPLAELKHQPWADPAEIVGAGSLRSLVSPQWHYVEHDTMGPALYDWKNGPQARKNVANNPELQGVVDMFRRQIAQR